MHSFDESILSPHNELDAERRVCRAVSRACMALITRRTIIKEDDNTCFVYGRGLRNLDVYRH